MKTATLHHDHQPAEFEFTADNMKKIKAIFALYPPGRQKSAIMPLLDLAQRQVAAQGERSNPPYGGWIPRAAMDKIAEILDMAPMRVYEVATFYSMYNLAPVGVNLVQVCTTTPCWLCGSAKIVEACEQHLGVHVGETTPDGLFTLVEVECLGACVNAPMVQINDDYFEDLTPESMKKLIDLLADGQKPVVGSQTGRKGSMALSGPTSLQDDAKKAGVA
jgi:NADH-quinone oxidoreductase subunit E